MSAGTVDAEVLRSLVREVLKELLPSVADDARRPASSRPAGAEPGQQRGGAPAAAFEAMPSPPAQPAAASARVAPAQPGPALTVRDTAEAVQAVTLRNDQDLAAFVTRLLHLFENPKRRADLRAGRLRFSLAGAAVAGSPQPVRRIEKGAVTEAAVKDAARAGARLVLGRRAVLTPLARDRARASGVEIERESS